MIEFLFHYGSLDIQPISKAFLWKAHFMDFNRISIHYISAMEFLPNVAVHYEVSIVIHIQVFYISFYLHSIHFNKL